MITIFSTPKPFRGHTNIIQRNAIKSWTLLHTDCEVILIGDDEGTTEVAREFGVRHEPNVSRNEYGTPFLNCIFDRAHEVARHDLLCYTNCNIILMSDFIKAMEQVFLWSKVFLMIGRRWDTDINESWDFDKPNWEECLQAHVLRQGIQRPPDWIDYFAFSRGIYYKKMVPFLIGRPMWDNWLISKTLSLKVPVVDVSPSVMAIHQNHDYSHHPEGIIGTRYGREAIHNYELGGGWRNAYSIDDATHLLTSKGIRRDFIHWFMALKRQVLYRSWFTMLLRIRRPLRHWIGLRLENILRVTAKIKLLISR